MKIKVVDTNTSLKKFGFDDTFERKLLNQIITNLKANDRENHFGDNVIEEIQPHHFSLTSADKIVWVLKQFYDKHKMMPSTGFVGLANMVRSYKTAFGVHKTNAILKQLVLIEESVSGVDLETRTAFVNFIDMDTVNEMSKVLDQVRQTGDISKLIEIGEIGTKLVEKRQDANYKIHDLFDLDEQIFERSDNVCLSTGFGDRFDEILGGGFYYGKNYTFIIPKNVGKTTTGTLFATQWAINHNKKVLHLFWEDSEKDIASKSAAYILKTSIDSLSANKDFKKTDHYKKLQELKDTRKGNYKLVRMRLGNSVMDIKSLVYDFIAKGFKPDMIIVDYLKKLSEVKGKTYNNTYEYLGQAANELTDLIDKDNHNMVGIFFQQSDRNSMSSEKVFGNQIKGDIEVVYPAHGVITFAQDKEMKVKKLVNLTVENLRGAGAGLGIDNMFMDGSNMLVESGHALSPNWEERTVDYWNSKGIEA